MIIAEVIIAHMRQIVGKPFVICQSVIRNISEIQQLTTFVQNLQIKV